MRLVATTVIITVEPPAEPCVAKIVEVLVRYTACIHVEMLAMELVLAAQ